MNAVTKICSICEADLNGKKRWKDAGGNYFCPTYWDARLNLAQSAPPASLPPSPHQDNAAAPVTLPQTASVGTGNDEIPAAKSENVVLKKLGFRVYLTAC